MAAQSAHPHILHKYCRVTAQKLPNIRAQSPHKSPNIGKYIPTSSRDDVDNGTFYCNNERLMADMESKRANGIWVRMPTSIKESLISQVKIMIVSIWQICMSFGKQETTGEIFTRCLFAESQSGRFACLLASSGQNGDKKTVFSQGAVPESDVVKTQASFTPPHHFPCSHNFSGHS